MTASVSPEVIEKWRSEFEAYHGAHARFVNGRYVEHMDQTLWVCWFKARQSAVIELPAPIEFDSGHDEPSYHYWPVQIKAALREQGYQVNQQPAGQE